MVTEKRLFQIVKNSINKWKKILQMDPVWKIMISVTDEEEMGNAFASVDTQSAEYYVAGIEFSSALMSLEEDKLKSVINDIVAHELLHIVQLDFFNTAKLCAGKNQSMHQELRYKYEQYTTRLQRSFVELDKVKNQVKVERKDPE
jgi:hypothetical protein